MSDWKIVEDLFLAATERPIEERGAFLSQACGNDADLQREVESLLAFDSGNTHSLSPIVEAGAAGFIQHEKMLGYRVGAYQINGSLGHGGMGAVYFAHRADDQ